MPRVVSSARPSLKLAAAQPRPDNLKPTAANLPPPKKKTCEGDCLRAATINERAVAKCRALTSEPKNAEGPCRLRGRTYVAES